MKRGKPLQRRTPLQPGKPLERRTPLAQGKSLDRKPLKAKPLRRAPMDKGTRAAVIDRAAGRCEHCRRPCHPDLFEVHHRKLRTRGGDDSMANLIALLPECHRAIHANPALATAWGFMLHSWDDPEQITPGVSREST